MRTIDPGLEHDRGFRRELQLGELGQQIRMGEDLLLDGDQLGPVGVGVGVGPKLVVALDGGVGEIDDGLRESFLPLA